MRGLRWAAWLIVALWFIVSLATIDYNGPFFDEAIYITAGQRTLEGYGLSDGYMGWFAGSLLWPALAGVGFRVAGLVGTRLLALLLVTAAFAAILRATENLFGPRAAFWTALALALCGPLLALARLGVYDAPALTGVAVAFWAITELARRDQRFYLGIAAVAFMFGLFSKYPMGLMLLPLLGVLFFLRRSKFLLDVGIWGFIALAITLAFLLPARQQVAALVAWQTVNKPTFGVSRSMILAGILYAGALPALLSLGGWLVARRRRGLATVLLLNLLLWPAYHLLSANPVSVNKHLVFSFALSYPLAGLALGALWDGLGRARRAAGEEWAVDAPAPASGPRRPPAWRLWLTRSAALSIVLVLGAYAAIQVNQSDHAWPDPRPAAEYLVAHVQPGQKLLVNESWPYTMYLYAQGRITSPWDVYDYYRITHGEAEMDLCAYDWFVDSQGSYAWPPAVRQGILQCGSYRQVFSSTSNVIALGADWNYVRYPVRVEVWQRISAGGAR